VEIYLFEQTNYNELIRHNKARLRAVVLQFTATPRRRVN